NPVCHTAVMFRRFFEQLDVLLASHQNVVLDNSPNIHPMYRRRLIEEATRHAYPSIAIVLLDTPLPVCIQHSTESPEWIEYVDPTLSAYRLPEASEGYLLILRPTADPCLYEMISTEQWESAHPEHHQPCELEWNHNDKLVISVAAVGLYPSEIVMAQRL